MTADRPNFDALMRPCTACEGAGCEFCDEPLFTPRTSAALHTAFRCLADDVYDDVDRYGDGPWSADTVAMLDQYPSFTWSCDGPWRRQAARAFDDLADDMVAGIRPQARCPAEEFAVISAVKWCEATIADVPDSFDFTGLPVMACDFQWSLLLDVLLEDLDMEYLLDPAMDGVENPTEGFNQEMRMGDYRPEVWFDIRSGYPPRDPARGFRRPGTPA